jgi:hypothetical protein
MTYKNLWDTAKAFLRGKLLPWVHILKDQKDLKSMIIILQLKFLEKQQANPKQAEERNN